jgi:hypothetical protein
MDHGIEVSNVPHTCGPNIPVIGERYAIAESASRIEAEIEGRDLVACFREIRDYHRTDVAACASNENPHPNSLSKEVRPPTINVAQLWLVKEVIVAPTKRLLTACGAFD